MSRILLINPNKKHCSDIKFLLYLNGYQIEVCETIDEGINRFMIFAELNRGFDLVLIVADTEQLTELERYKNDSFFDKVVVLHEKRTKPTRKASPLKSFSTCQPELVLDYVKKHLEKPGSKSNPLSKLKSFSFKKNHSQEQS